MKAIFLVVVLLFGFSSAKPKPAKKELTCSDFPKQLSGKLYMLVVSDSGDSSTIDMDFNLDINLQMFQAESAYNGAAPVNVINDYKGGKTYVIFEGGCYASPLDAKLLDPEDLKGMHFDVAGKLGLKGTSVALYGGLKDGAHYLTTLESGNQCIPVSFASKEPGSASTGSFLDLKTTASTEKMKIPEHCSDQQMDTRSIVQKFHAADLQKAVKRGFPWITLQGGQKRGLPWKGQFPQRIDLQALHKRAYPWLALLDAAQKR